MSHKTIKGHVKQKKLINLIHLIVFELFNNSMPVFFSDRYTSFEFQNPATMILFVHYLNWNISKKDVLDMKWISTPR